CPCVGLAGGRLLSGGTSQRSLFASADGTAPPGSSAHCRGDESGQRRRGRLSAAGKRLRPEYVRSQSDAIRARQPGATSRRRIPRYRATRRCMTSKRAWLLVGFLGVALFLDNIDRHAVFSIFPVLKSKLRFTDVELGLTGSVFLSVYALCFPIASQIGVR